MSGNLGKNYIYLHPRGLKSWKEAKVTAGGVDTNELTKYLESKKYPGLFFIGEIVDITGHTGGYNLQWAWSSAYCMSEKFN